jgi:DNA-directed RNA polymerase specialized sigma24 family protein
MGKPLESASHLDDIKTELDELDAEVRDATGKQLRARMTDVEESFAQFYKDHADAVFRALVMVTRDRVQAEDLTAEAFVRAFSNWSRLSTYSNPRAWVIRTALNQFRDLRRRGQWSKGDHGDYGPANYLDPELMSAVRELPKRQREMVALRYLKRVAE